MVITGASKGIGLACAKRFALEGCASLHLISRTKADLETAKASILAESAAVNVHTHVFDLGAKGNVAALWKAIDECGAVSILVNNAGAIPAGGILKIDEDTWREAWDLKVFGYINMTREAYSRMKKSGDGGTVVNIIGTGGVR